MAQRRSPHPKGMQMVGLEFQKGLCPASSNLNEGFVFQLPSSISQQAPSPTEQKFCMVLLSIHSIVLHQVGGARAVFIRSRKGNVSPQSAGELSAVTRSTNC